MTPTLLKPLRRRLIYRTTEELTSWLNEELLPFLQGVKQAADYVSRVKPTWTTNASGVFETMWTSDDIAVGTLFRIDASILGAAAANTDRAMFTITGLFFNDGLTQQEPATVVGPTINPAGYAVQFLVVANHVELQVRDAGAVAVQWVAIVDATGAP